MVPMLFTGQKQAFFSTQHCPTKSNEIMKEMTLQFTKYFMKNHKNNTFNNKNTTLHCQFDYTRWRYHQNYTTVTKTHDE